MNLSKITFLLIPVIFSTTPSTAQLKDTILDLGNEPFASVIAINPKNPKNIVAGATHRFVCTSFDEGKTWQKAVVNPNDNLKSTSSLIADSKGNFYYAYVSDTLFAVDKERKAGGGIIVQRSENGGKTWQNLEGIELTSPSHCDKIWISVDVKGNLYMTWTHSNIGNDQSKILFSMSSNKGRKWSAPDTLSQMPGKCSSNNKALGAKTAVMVDGKIFVAWLNQGKVHMDRSYDDASMWLSNDITVSQLKYADFAVNGFNREMDQPILLCDNSKSMYSNSLYLLGTQKRQQSDDLDISFIRSHNGGDNWTSPLYVNKDEPGTLQFMPAMAIDQSNGYIYIAYYNQQKADDESTDVFIAYSKDGGASFTNTKVSKQSFTMSDSESSQGVLIKGPYLSIAAQNGIITPIWVVNENGKRSLHMATVKQSELEKK